jgi:hypothetical protein
MGCIENQHCTRQVLMPDLALFVIDIVLAQDGMPASAPLHSERKSQHLPPCRRITSARGGRRIAQQHNVGFGVRT